MISSFNPFQKTNSGWELAYRRLTNDWYCLSGKSIPKLRILCGRHTACAHVPGEAEQRPSLRRFPNNLSSVTKPFAAMVTDARWVDSIMVRAPHGRSLSGPALFLSGRTDPFLMSYSCQLLQSGIGRLRFHCAVSANNHWMVRLFRNRAVTVLL